MEHTEATDYTNIADRFISSRKSFIWPSFLDFAKYMENGAKVLDVGCGGGRVLGFLKNKGMKIAYVGVDSEPSMIEGAKREYPDADFRVMDMRSLDFKDGEFDFIWAVASFHHLQTKTDRIKTLIGFKRILSERGMLFMTNWNFSGSRFLFDPVIQAKRVIDGIYIPWKDSKTRQPLTQRYYHGFYLRELRSLLTDNGFNIEEEFYENRLGHTAWFQGYNMCHICSKQ